MFLDEDLKYKAQKITEALYRTTDLLYDGEPLKWSLRSSAVEIINIIFSLDSMPIHEQGRVLKNLDGLVKLILSKLELAMGNQFVSRANFEVLKREYSGLYSVVSKAQLKGAEALSDKFLLDIGISDKEQEVSDRIEDSAEDNKEKSSSLLSIGEILKGSVVNNTEDSSSNKHPDRRSVLLSALQSNGVSSVGELTRLFSGSISEKTVQRELNDLVTSGEVKMNGDKRWRRYFL